MKIDRKITMKIDAIKITSDTRKNSLNVDEYLTVTTCFVCKKETIIELKMTLCFEKL